MFNSIPGLYPLGTSGILPRCDNQKSLQILPYVLPSNPPWAKFPPVGNYCPSLREALASACLVAMVTEGQLPLPDTDMVLFFVTKRFNKLDPNLLLQKCHLLENSPVEKSCVFWPKPSSLLYSPFTPIHKNPGLILGLLSRSQPLFVATTINDR